MSKWSDAAADEVFNRICDDVKGAGYQYEIDAKSHGWWSRIEIPCNDYPVRLVLRRVEIGAYWGTQYSAAFIRISQRISTRRLHMKAVNMKWQYDKAKLLKKIKELYDASVQLAAEAQVTVADLTQFQSKIEQTFPGCSVYATSATTAEIAVGENVVTISTIPDDDQYKVTNIKIHSAAYTLQEIQSLLDWF